MFFVFPKQSSGLCLIIERNQVNAIIREYVITMELHLYTNGILIMMMINRAELLLLFVTTVGFNRSYNMFKRSLFLQNEWRI